MTRERAARRISIVPVFDTVHDAVAETGADASMIYVPAAFAADAILEAPMPGSRSVVCITEGIPVLDMLKVALHWPAATCASSAPTVPA